MVTKKMLITIITTVCLISGCHVNINIPSSSSSEGTTIHEQTADVPNGSDISHNESVKEPEIIQDVKEPEVIQEPQKTTADSTSVQKTGYSLNVGGVTIYNIRLPEKEIQDAKEDIIQLQTDDYVYVVYADSYIDNNGSTALLDKEMESIASVYDTQPQMHSVEKDDLTGYVITWETKDYNCVRIYQPIMGAKTYLKIDITDHSKLHYDQELIDSYWLYFDKVRSDEHILMPLERTANSALSLNIGGILCNALPIPQEWVTSVSDILIQTNPTANLYVNYSDSYVNVGDIAGINEAKQSVDKANDVEAQLDTFVYNGQTGYILSWNMENWHSVRIYQPIKHASSYLLVDITDHDKMGETWELANKYALGI